MWVFSTERGDITRFVARSAINDEATLLFRTRKERKNKQKEDVCRASESRAGPTAAGAVPEATNGHGTRSQTPLAPCESSPSVRKPQPHSRWTAIPNLTPARGARVVVFSVMGGGGRPRSIHESMTKAAGRKESPNIECTKLLRWGASL